MSSTAAVFGSTGLVGSHILSTVLSPSSAYSAVSTISRRAPKADDAAKLHATVEGDTSRWAAQLSALSPAPATVFSAVGTTRAQAGGVAAQWKIDHDLNVELARAAKAAGVRTFVFISSAGTRGFLSDRVPYSKMKVGVEDAVQKEGFDNAIIVRPGAILGEREVPHTGMPFLMGVIRGLGKIHQSAQDTFGQEADVIGRAAVHAARIAEEGKAPSKFWVLEQADIIRLGRTEWKD